MPHRSLEVCIDPDSRGMTVSVALYTPGFLRDPTENGKRTARILFSGIQTGKVVTRLFAFFIFLFTLDSSQKA